MMFRVTDEQGWEQAFEATTAEVLAAGVRRAWDARILESPLARAEIAGSVHGVHPAFAFRARKAWIDRWLEEHLAVATPSSDVRSWRAQAALWHHQVRVEFGADEHLSPLRLHVFAPGDEGMVSQWSTLAIRTPAGFWACAPVAPRVARELLVARAQELYAGAEAICAHARNLAALADHAGEAVGKVQYPKLRLIHCAGR